MQTVEILIERDGKVKYYSRNYSHSEDARKGDCGQRLFVFSSLEEAIKNVKRDNDFGNENYTSSCPKEREL